MSNGRALLKLIRQLGVVETEQMQHGSVQVVDVDSEAFLSATPKLPCRNFGLRYLWAN